MFLRRAEGNWLGTRHAHVEAQMSGWTIWLRSAVPSPRSFNLLDDLAVAARSAVKVRLGAG